MNIVQNVLNEANNLETQCQVSDEILKFANSLKQISNNSEEYHQKLCHMKEMISEECDIILPKTNVWDIKEIDNINYIVFVTNTYEFKTVETGAGYIEIYIPISNDTRNLINNLSNVNLYPEQFEEEFEKIKQLVSKENGGIDIPSYDYWSIKEENGNIYMAFGNDKYDFRSDCED